MSAWYLDTSAFVKLVRTEPETQALRAHLRGSSLVSCDLLRTEALRATHRAAPELLPRCRLLLDRVDAMIRIDAALLTTAGTIDPPSLRSLDAIHLAAVLAGGDDLDGVVTYDRRMAEAAAGVGAEVARPE